MECPDYFKLDSKDILLFTSRNKTTRDQFRNIYQSGYLIGDLNFDSLSFDHSEFVELDNGFDFYAPQTF